MLQLYKAAPLVFVVSGTFPWHPSFLFAIDLNPNPKPYTLIPVPILAPVTGSVITPIPVPAPTPVNVATCPFLPPSQSPSLSALNAVPVPILVSLATSLLPPPRALSLTHCLVLYLLRVNGRQAKPGRSVPASHWSRQRQWASCTRGAARETCCRPCPCRRPHCRPRPHHHPRHRPRSCRCPVHRHSPHPHCRPGPAPS
jgi:hypothetical protein